MDKTVHLPNLSLWNYAPEPRLALSPIDPAVQLSLQVAPCALDLHDLSFSYERKRPILRGVNARFEPGNIYVIRGRNGAGKSTLAKLLSGVLPCPRGQIKCDGETVVPYRQPGRLVGYHFQNPDVQFVARTVEEDVTAGPAARGLKSEALATRVDSILAVFGLSNLRSMDILDLPFVLRKRLALASMIAAGAPWMIFDEPTLGQDDEYCCRLAKVFSTLCRLGVGVIVISHASRFIDHLPVITFLLEEGELSHATMSKL